MATFTIKLKDLIEFNGGTVVVDNNGRSILTNGGIGLDHYSIFDTNYRDTLNGNIVDHFWNREIGQETGEIFEQRMRSKMNLIMPYYNEMYKSTKVEYDPLSTINLTTIGQANLGQTGTSESSASGKNNATSGSRSVNSDTPQTMLKGDGDYATSGSDVNAVTSTDSETKQTGNETNTTTNSTNTNTSGYQGVASDLIIRYRDSLINIDLMIINELEELFMLIYDNGDEYGEFRNSFTRGFVL